MTEDHRLIKSAKSARDSLRHVAIPDDVMKAAIAARADGHSNPNWYLEQPHVDAIARAILAEREACAKIAYTYADDHSEGHKVAGHAIARRILYDR